MSVIIFITVGIKLSEREKAFLLLSVMLLNLLKFQRGGDIAKLHVSRRCHGTFPRGDFYWSCQWFENFPLKGFVL